MPYWQLDLVKAIQLKESCCQICWPVLIQHKYLRNRTFDLKNISDLVDSVLRLQHIEFTKESILDLSNHATLNVY